MREFVHQVCRSSGISNIRDWVLVLKYYFQTRMEMSIKSNKLCMSCAGPATFQISETGFQICYFGYQIVCALFFGTFHLGISYFLLSGRDLEAKSLDQYCFSFLGLPPPPPRFKYSFLTTKNNMFQDLPLLTKKLKLFPCHECFFLCNGLPGQLCESYFVLYIYISFYTYQQLGSCK